MSKFVLTAQLQLKAPANTQQVVSQMRRQLSGINVNVGVKGAPQAQRQVAKVNQQVSKLNKSGARLGKTFGLAINRFAAFTVASRGVSLFTNGLANATREAIDFERELVKISQVTGKTIQELSGLNNTITQLSVNLGTSSKDLLATTRILAQAGIQARDLDVALAALAKTTLAPTFEDITKTAEGAVAILAQFGQGVGALESQLGAINAVAGQFAVESGDLISVVRRTGGVFKAAGGDLNELLGLFTSVRATTRESAESIATGLRTIFTRIPRPKTIECLKQFGVELTDLNGKFVGPFEAVKQLSAALSGLGEGDIRFVQIAEELGGFRQIGKVIPLLQQFETAERARQAALEGGDSLTKDAATAQQALAIQITKVKEEFLALVRSISQTGSFQTLVKTTLDLASALISVADALKPIIPLLTLFAGIKLARGLTGFGAGVGAALKGGPRGFNSGGLVPGTGNRDTVPAMLTPGEFVIRKSSVEKLGASTLAEMNGNKFNKGGEQKKKKRTPLEYRLPTEVGQVSPVGTAKDARETTYSTTLASLRQRSKRNFLPGEDGKRRVNIRGRVKDLVLKKEENESVFSEKSIIEPMFKYGDSIIKRQLKAVDGRFNAKSPLISDANAKRTIGGFAFESFTSGLAGISAGGEGTPFDFTGTAGSRLTKFVEQERIPDFVDAKRSQQVPKKILQKAVSDSTLAKRLQQVKALGGFIKKFALGGLALKNRVGFAILDPDRKAQDMDAKVTRAQIRTAVKGTEGQRKALDKELSWPNKNFKVARQGLNAKTSQRFYDTLSREAAQGVSVAAAGLSNDLGLGNITVPETSKQLMADSIRKSGSMMGKIFEDVVNVMDGRGKFSPSPPGAPFDFKGGLQGALKDNYDRLPSTFVDAKTSYAEASTAEAQKKIINEIAQTYQQTATYSASKKGDKRGETDKQAAARIARERKGQERLAKLRAKAGYNMGGAAPSDTVPALLTPGEFVINKKAASKIGKANLDRMNKQGVQGFATGGVVQRFANGGGATNFGNFFNSGINLQAAAERRAASQSSAGNEVKKQESTLVKALQSISKSVINAGIAITKAPQQIKGLDTAITNTSNAITKAGTNISSGLSGAGKVVQAADSRIGNAFNKIVGVATKEGSLIQKSFSGVNRAVQSGQKLLSGGFSGVVNSINIKGPQVLDGVLRTIARKTPQLNEAFSFISKGIKVSGEGVTAALSSAKNKIATSAPVAAGPKTRTVYSSKGTGAFGRTFDGRGARIEAAQRSLEKRMKFQGVSARNAAKGLQALSVSAQQGDSRAKMLAKGMAAAGVTTEKLKAAQQKAAAASEKAAKMAEQRAEREKQRQQGGGGRFDAMGAFFALSSISMMIPKVEGATEGLGAVQNASGDLVMQLGTFGFVVQSLGVKMNAFTGGLGGALAAVYAITTIMDAYSGVHEKAKAAVEEGRIQDAGAAAVSSQAQKDLNKLALGAAAAGAAIGSVVPVVGTLAGALVGGLIGAGAGIATKLLPESVVNDIRDRFSTIFGTDSTELIKARAEAAAALKKAELGAADAADKAAEALKRIASGQGTLLEAFESGELTQSIQDFRIAVGTAVNQEKVAQRQRANTLNVEKTLGVSDGALETGGVLAGIGAGATAGAFIGAPAFGVGALPAAIIGGIAGGLAGFGGASLFTGADERADKKLEESKKLRAESEKALNDAIKKRIPEFNQLGRELFRAGASFGDFVAKIESFPGFEDTGFGDLDPLVQKKLAQGFRNNAIAVAENTAAFSRITLGLRPVIAATSGLNVSLDRTISIVEGKFNGLSSALSTVEAGLSGATIDTSEFDQALAQINSEFKSFGVADSTINKLNKNFNALRIASGGFQDALEKVQDKVINDELGGKSIKEVIISELTNLQGLDDAGRKIIADVFGNIDFTGDDIEALASNDFSSILNKLDEAGKKAFEKSLAAGNALAEAQNKLIKLAEQRASSEAKMIAAQIKSINLQEEALKLRGRENTSSKIDFARRRASSQLGTDISAANATGVISSIQAGVIAATGRLTGAAGGGSISTFQNRQDRLFLDKANKDLDALATFARERASIYKQELEIVKKKNALERSALDKLISGDTIGFIEDQAAAAAASALRMGDASTALQFSSQALSAGFKSLEGQGLSDADMRRAARTALGPFASARNIGVLSQTTSEESAIKAAIDQSASILDQIAPAIQVLGSADFKISVAGLKKANQDFVNAQTEAAKASEQMATSLQKSADLAKKQAEAAQEAIKATEGVIERANQALSSGDAKSSVDIDARGANVNVTLGSRATGAMLGPAAAAFSQGGPVYASRGMFVPRGTDTVPAMLTPGEFVVNRAAVQRGNNLQVLKAMNGNNAAPAPAAEGMSNGGTVYRRRGGRIFGGQESGGMDMTAMFKTFESSAKVFSDAVNKLTGFKLNVQLDPTNVNVNLNGGTFLNQMKNELKNELLSIVSERIRGSSFDFTGDINIDPYTQSLS